MKIRHGFVSNSSSSSFVCCVSGTVVSGWDLNRRDAEMTECEAGHNMLDAYIVAYMGTLIAERGIEYVRELIREHYNVADYDINTEVIVSPRDFVMEVMNVGVDGRYDLPSCFCPVCNLVYISDADILAYALWNAGDTRKGLVEEMRSRFVMHDVFRETTKGKGGVT